jgi:hypothetical protein
MPTHNNFAGHIVWVDCTSTPRRNKYIKEHYVEKDGKTVTCYIAAEAGRFFAGTWWYNSKNPRTAQPYTAEFIHDGQLIYVGTFSRILSATIQGVGGETFDPVKKEWMYLMFKETQFSGDVLLIEPL